MLADTISKVNNITFDSTSLNAYTTSLRGLSETQARVVLSSTNLDKVQKQQILNKLAETNATVSLTSAEATETLTRRLGSKEAANELLVKSGLVTKEQLLAGTTLEVSAAKLQDAVNTGLITEAEKTKILTALGLTTSNVGLATSFKLLGKQIGYATLQMLKWLVTTPVGMLTLIAGGLTVATLAISKYNEKLEENRQEMIAAGKEASRLTEDLDGLIEEYRKLGEDGAFDNSDREQAKNIQQQINDLLGDEALKVNLVNGNYEEQLKLLRKIQYEKANGNYATIKEAKDAAEDSLRSKISNVGVGNNIAKSEMEAIEKLSKLPGMSKYLKTYEGDEKGRGKFAMFNVDVSSTDAMIASYEKMVELRNILSKSNEDEIKKGGSLEDFYNNLTDEISELSDAVTKYQDAIDDYNINEAVIQFNETEFDGVTGALIRNEDQLKKWLNSMLASEDISDGVKQELLGLASTYFPNMSDAVGEATKEYIKNQVAAGGDITSLRNLASTCGITEQAFDDLVFATTLFNNKEIDVDSKIAKLRELGYELDVVNTKMNGYYVKTGSKGQYVGDMQIETIDGKRYAVYYDNHNKVIKKELLTKEYNDDNDDSKYTPTTDKDSSSKNEPLDNYLKYAESLYKVHQDEAKYINDLQWAYNNLTKDEDERLKVTEKINEAYRDMADNRIKDLEHQIEMTKNLNGEDADVIAQLNEIQRVAHEEAERLRSMGYDDNSNEIQDLQKSWWDAEKKKLDWRLNLSKDWIDERNRLGDWNLFNDNEVDAWERVIKWLKEEYPHAIDEIKEAEESLFEARKEQMDKLSDFGSSYLDSHKTLLQAYYDTTNAVEEGFHEINKELETSKTMYEWLDEDTRKLLFNQEDYNTLYKELNDIQREALNLKYDYEDALDNATLDTIEEITSNYEMQYEMLMKSYEIAKADLEVAKKKAKLNNVLNERNVRMFINGQWQWVANTQDVIDAKAELADAEYAQRMAKAGLTQQESINNLTRQQNELGTVISQFESGVIDLDTATSNIVEMFGKLPTAMQEAIDRIGSSLSSSSGSSKSSSSSGGLKSIVSSLGTEDSVRAQMAANSAAWGSASASDKVKLHEANKVLGESIGLKFNDKSGKWYANGTRYTESGLIGIGEEEPEIFIDKNGHLIPINQPILGNFGAGGVVFNQDQMAGVRELWDLSNIVTPSTSLVNNARTSSESFVFSGDINVYNPTDAQDVADNVVAHIVQGLKLQRKSR